MCDLTEAAENVRRMEAAYKATEIPQAPAVRHLDELAPIPAGRRAVENIAGTCAAVAVLVLAFIP